MRDGLSEAAEHRILLAVVVKALAASRVTSPRFQATLIFGDRFARARRRPRPWPSPKGHRVGLRIGLFEACSAFIHIAVCTTGAPPNVKSPMSFANGWSRGESNP
ncbi:MAG: hypothetical protein B7Y90_13850 [Alphaproteobacteria bacterium 32-64-14]|nr:MAG: hypothetical protein B7Y90_13850 [Alphaproteobacteria bacterium 32-64-14]